MRGDTPQRRVLERHYYHAELMPFHSTFQRKPRKRVVSRSFRMEPAVDRELTRRAREKGVSKSWLIRDIIRGQLEFWKAQGKTE